MNPPSVSDGSGPPGPELSGPTIRAVVGDALREDLASGDVTTDLLVLPATRARAAVRTREPGVVAGIPVARAVFRAGDEGVEVEATAGDGDAVAAGDTVLRLEGPARAILRAERTALNFLQRMSGTATLTARFVAAVEGTGVRIVDTRKTTPGLRSLEKYAVRCGGGRNHRSSLGDGFLLKDNHRAILAHWNRDLASAVREARSVLSHTVSVEVEVDGPEQIAEALDSGADVILLDNFSLPELRRAVEQVAGRTLLEASGGITLETVREIAETGVDLISVGALTHSAPALDLSLDFETEAHQ